MASRLEQLQRGLARAREHTSLLGCATQLVLAYRRQALQDQAIKEAQLEVILQLEEKNLDLTRCALRYAEMLVVEIENPGTANRDLAYAALDDWADQYARTSELVI